MKTSHCLWISMCISFLSHAQTPLDSLKDLLTTARHKDYKPGEAYYLYYIGSYFYHKNQYDSSLYYYNKVLELEPQASDSASAFNGLGVTYSAMGLPHKSIPYYNQAIALYERSHDTTNALTNSYNLAIIYKDIGLYDEALEISFKTLAQLEVRKPDRTLASSYNTIGSVYSRIQDYERAYEYYRKGLLVRLQIGYEQGVGQSYNNIGELFYEMGQYDSALKNLSAAINIRRTIDDTRGLGRTLTQIGNTWMKKGDAHLAREELIRALAINRSSNDNIGEIATLNGLGATHIALREFKLAESSLRQALELINKTKVKEHLVRNLELHTEVYRAVDDQPKLARILERMLIVKDSLLNAEKVESLQAAETRYETEKKEREITNLHQERKIDRAELDRNRFQILALSIGLGLISLIGFLGYRVYTQSQKAKLSAELHMREVQHRMKNHLQILSSLFTIQATILEDKKAQEVVRDIEGRVNSMGLLHKKLYNMNETTEVGLREYVRELTTSLLFSYGLDEGRVNLDVDVVADLRIPVDKAVRIGLILNELITNSLKYAFGDQQDPRLTIQILSTGRSLRLNVSDNGKGTFSFGESSVNSFGLRMVKSLVRELKGTLEVQTNDGTHYSITMP